VKYTDARQPGYDAFGKDGRIFQIKSRCLLTNTLSGQRMGSIRSEHTFDTLMLVLMDNTYEPLLIYEAKRKDFEKELQRPGSKVRNIRGELIINKFIIICERVWSRKSYLTQ